MFRNRRGVLSLLSLIYILWLANNNFLFLKYFFETIRIVNSYSILSLTPFASILSYIYMFGPRSTKLLNTDPIRIRIHSAVCDITSLLSFLHHYIALLSFLTSLLKGFPMLQYICGFCALLSFLAS